VSQPTTGLVGPLDLLAQAFALYRERFFKVLGAYLLGLLAAVPIMVVVGLFAVSGYLISDPTTANIFNIVLAVLGAVAVVCAVYFGLRAQLTGLIIIAGDSQGTVGEAYRKAKPFVWSFLALILITAIFTLLWTLLFIIPGIIFAVSYVFAQFVFLFEGLRFTAALKRSRELVKGHWWAVFGRLVCMWLVYVVVGIVLSMFGKAGGEGTQGALAGLQMIINFLMGPLYVIYVFLLYRSLAALKPAAA
jgi:uncharacterized membrane protein